MGIGERKDDKEGDTNGGTHASCARLSSLRSCAFRGSRVCAVGQNCGRRERSLYLYLYDSFHKCD
jgi:hypothetical protein